MSIPGELTAALGYKPTAPEWVATSVPPIPMERFGKDHWSTFAYVETRIVDHKGMLNHDHMRCDASRHMMLASAGKRSILVGPADGKKYPTRLKTQERNAEGRFDSENLADHDDYDCIDDLVAAGLMEIHMPRQAVGRNAFEDAQGRVVRDSATGGVMPSDFVTGMGEGILAGFAHFSLTPKGERIAGELRAWKGKGGNFHGFVPSELLAVEAKGARSL